MASALQTAIRAVLPSISYIRGKEFPVHPAEKAALMRKRYPSDVSDAQWAVLETLIPPARPGGRPRKVDMREVVNAIFYQARTGCPWDYLPHDLPPKSSVWDYFECWRDDGTLQKLVDTVRKAPHSAGQAIRNASGLSDN